MLKLPKKNKVYVMVLNLYEKLHQSSIYIYIFWEGGGGVWGEVGEEKYIITRKIKCSISCPPKIEMEALYKIINMLSKNKNKKEKKSLI